jgi:hypothetical protein
MRAVRGWGQSTRRGQLLDVAVVALHVGAVGTPHGLVIELVAAADRDRAGAIALAAVCLAMLLLPAAGAVLKRWASHQRWAEEPGGAAAFRPGCLFHPIVYFCLSATLASAVVAGVGTAFLGPRFLDDGPAFVGLLLAGLLLAVASTVLVYRYFEPPRRPPRWPFLRSPAAAALGDGCLFVQMVLFQAVWDAFATIPFGPIASLEDAIGRVVFLALAAGLVYLPPRMLYLIEDLRRPGTWLTLALANGAMVLRIVFGAA